MKTLVRSILVFALVSLVAFGSAAQKQKFGHIDSNELLKLMPGRDSAVAQITAYANTLENQVKGMQAEFETKYNEYMANETKMTDLIKQTKMREIQDIQARIEAFQASAEEDLQKKQQELLQPIIDKAKAAIEKVAKANGYTYVLDAGLGVLLFSDPTDDIMPLVKTELGIK